MSWLEKKLKGEKDQEIARIREDLETEKTRHNKRLGEINRALEEYSRVQEEVEGKNGYT